MSFALALLFVVSAPDAVAGRRAESSGIELEQAVLQSRQCIKHGRLRLHVRFVFRNTLDSAGDAAESRNLEYEFDDSRIRLHDEHAGVTRILTLSHFIGSDKSRTDVLQPKLAGEGVRDDVFHPRVLGLGITSTLALDNFWDGQLIAFADRKNEKITNEMLDGIDVRHLSYDRATGTHIDYWIAMDDHARILKAMAESSPYVDTLSIAWGRYAPNVSFPQSLHFQQRNGEQVLIDELTTVEAADFSEAPATERFSLASLELKPGTIVMDNGIARMWDGSSLKSLEHLNEPVVIPPKDSAKGRLSWLFGINAILLALAALYFRVFRKRPSN